MGHTVRYLRKDSHNGVAIKHMPTSNFHKINPRMISTAISNSSSQNLCCRTHCELSQENSRNGVTIKHMPTSNFHKINPRMISTAISNSSSQNLCCGTHPGGHTVRYLRKNSRNGVTIKHIPTSKFPPIYPG